MRARVRTVPLAFRTTGTVENVFHRLTGRPPFESEKHRHEWRERLNHIQGVDIAANAINGIPNFPLRLLSDGDAFDQFCRTYQWVIDTLEQHLETSDEPLTRRPQTDNKVVLSASISTTSPATIAILGERRPHHASACVTK